MQWWAFLPVITAVVHKIWHHSVYVFFNCVATAGRRIDGVRLRQYHIDLHYVATSVELTRGIRHA